MSEMDQSGSACKQFIEIVLARSDEHAEAFSRLDGLPGSMASLLRQELDSLVRVIYLLSLSDNEERNRLMLCTLNNKLWTKKGKRSRITDAEMVSKANELEGWTKSVYKFGCAFIHLTNFHGYLSSNPLLSIEEAERRDVLDHMRKYHSGPKSDNPSFNELSSYFPKVFSKIKRNLECYLRTLEETL